MNLFIKKAGLALALTGCLSAALTAASDPKAAILRADRLQPKALAALLASKSSSSKPSLIHIGFQELYRQGLIPVSIYAGPASTAQGLNILKARLKDVSRTQALVIYCGCCPWGDCPNVLPAYKLLKDLGFKKVKVLEMQRNFGSDWTDKGFPEAKGE